MLWSRRELRAFAHTRGLLCAKHMMEVSGAPLRTLGRSDSRGPLPDAATPYGAGARRKSSAAARHTSGTDISQ